MERVEFLEKRVYLTQYCLLTPCSKCKMRKYGWKHKTDDEDECLDIPMADEGEIDLAYKLIEGSI